MYLNPRIFKIHLIDLDNINIILILIRAKYNNKLILNHNIKLT